MCKIRHVDRAVNDKNILDNILLSIDSKKTIKHNSSWDNILLLIDNKNHQPKQSLGCKILSH